jgi:hypothetical protein
MNDALEAQRRPAMKKISTVAIERIEIFKEHQLTIGLDLGDRTSYYCILNEAGEVILEHKLPTTPKGMEEVFGRIPRMMTVAAFCGSRCKSKWGAGTDFKTVSGRS